MYVYVYMNTHVYVCICMYACVCLYVYMHVACALRVSMRCALSSPGKLMCSTRREHKPTVSARSSKSFSLPGTSSAESQSRNAKSHRAKA